MGMTKLMVGVALIKSMQETVMTKLLQTNLTLQMVATE